MLFLNKQLSATKTERLKEAKSKKKGRKN